MRHYSKKEQNIINQILEIGKNTSSSNNMLFGIYIPIFDLYKVNINDQGLYFDSNQTQEIITLIESNIASRSILIDDLIKNRLIKLVKVGSTVPFSYMPFRNNNLHDEIDSSIFDILKDSFYSKVFVSQELHDLVSNDFRTYEDIQLEEARKQTNIANESLKEASKQTNIANESLAEAQKQRELANESLGEAQKQTKSAKCQTWLSIGAVILSFCAIIASIFVPRCTSSTLDQKQFDTIQMKQDEVIKTLNEVKTIQITNDSLIKELNLANESIDEISNTLKEIKELNSKRK